ILRRRSSNTPEELKNQRQAGKVEYDLEAVAKLAWQDATKRTVRHGEATTPGQFRNSFLLLSNRIPALYAHILKETPPELAAFPDFFQFRGTAGFFRISPAAWWCAGRA